MNYQQTPGNGSIPAGPPPGWYPDPNGFQAPRWWDGAQWGPQTRPLPGLRQESQPPHTDPAAGASEGYGAFGQRSPDWPAEQGSTQDSGPYGPGSVSGPYPASFPPAGLQQDPYQPQGPHQPQGWPQQHYYAPGLQPPAHRAPRRPGRRRARGALIGLGTLIGIIVVIAAATAHNSPSAGNVAATSTTSAAPSAAPASAASSPDCTSQVVSWRDNGGLSQLDTIVTDMGNVSSEATTLGADLSAGTDPSQDEASLQTAAASLQSDAQTAQANLPPSCVPHMRTDYGAALNDASKAALDCQDAVSELGSGNYAVAADDVNAANAAMTASGKKFQVATADVKAFSNG